MTLPTITKEQKDVASDFAELVIYNNDTLLEKFREMCNEFNNTFKNEEKRFCSPTKIMRLSIYYTKLYNCYLTRHTYEIVTTHFWGATDIRSEDD